MSGFPRYWTWEELQRFLLDNDLVIAKGMDEDDEVTLTARGEELFDVDRTVDYLLRNYRS